MNSYRVEVKELQHAPGTKNVVLVDVADFATMNRWASLDQELSKYRETCYMSMC